MQEFVLVCVCVWVCVQECTFVLKQKRVCSLQRSISVAEWFPEAPHKRHCKAIKLPPVLTDVPAEQEEDVQLYAAARTHGGPTITHTHTHARTDQ